jgi:hypothetical protein
VTDSFPPEQKQEDLSGESVATGSSPPSMIQNPKSISWARIAAQPPSANNVVIRHQKVVIRTRTPPKPTTYPPEPLADQLRVVWVGGCTKKTPLAFITDQIYEGSLLSVAFAENEAAMCIVFQHGASAAAFLETNAVSLNSYGECCYGPGYELMVGEPLPMNADLKAMQNPPRERRRLTFVKAGLFQDLSKTQFERDIEDLVGRDNMERVWIFNTGNGMIILLVNQSLLLTEYRYCCVLEYICGSACSGEL